jgi:hypothetical protein
MTPLIERVCAFTLFGSISLMARAIPAHTSFNSFDSA